MLNHDLHQLAMKTREEKIINERLDGMITSTIKEGENIEGTVLNHVMCSLENKSLMAVFDWLNSQNIEVGLLVFDGLMIYKNNSINIKEVLEGCSQAVKDKIGCDITFTVKEMDEGYNIPADSQIPPSLSESTVNLLF